MKGFIFHQMKNCRTSLSEAFFTKVFSSFFWSIFSKISTTKTDLNYVAPLTLEKQLSIMVISENFSKGLIKTVLITRTTGERLCLKLTSHVDMSMMSAYFFFFFFYDCNTTGTSCLSRHEQVPLMGLLFERYFVK